MIRAVLVVLAAVPAWLSAADWPTVRGSNLRSGYVEASLKLPLRVQWVCEFKNERLGTAVEPVVAGGLVLAATHAGNIYAIDAESGARRWCHRAHAAFLHSPVVAGDHVICASADGYLHALDLATGKLVWRTFVGSVSASPMSVADRVYVGTRGGDFVAVDAISGKLLWRKEFDVPIRQTAAADANRIYFTSEDLRVHCLNARDGAEAWSSDPLEGQTARDYYPVVHKEKGRTFIIVRTNPILNMGQRIGRDRTFLCRSAGIDDSSWKTIDAWIKSPEARGTPELWAREQSAMVDYLKTNREARTFFVLDTATGAQAEPSPVLWAAGCQGVGTPPVSLPDGRLLVFYRTAYGNWNHGVAPLVGLGLLELTNNRITPLFHNQGKQPPWNTFWGTADESENFVVAGKTVLIVHQGTLSGFDLETGKLFAIAGERDTYGGLRSPPWARNEWHGPARSGVAVVGDHVYWQTGSRILALAPQAASNTLLTVTCGDAVSPAIGPPRDALQKHLIDAVRETLSDHWAPLFMDPGLAGRKFCFDNSGEIFEALAWAYPHIPNDLQRKAKDYLRQQWTEHPPHRQSAFYALGEGRPREWFRVPNDYRARLGKDRQPHPFGNLYAIALWAKRCGEQEIVMAKSDELVAAFRDFEKTWRIDAQDGRLFGNRYLASLMAFERLAPPAAEGSAARKMIDENVAGLIKWWQLAATNGTLRDFKGSAQLDPFIGKGDALSVAVAPHRHELAIFADLTPEVARLLKEKAPESIPRVWNFFSELYATWYLVGEERQVHFGENFVDSPYLALNGFKALTWFAATERSQLANFVDLPVSRADLAYITKLALALESD